MFLLGLTMKCGLIWDKKKYFEKQSAATWRQGRWGEGYVPSKRELPPELLSASMHLMYIFFLSSLNWLN